MICDRRFDNCWFFFSSLYLPQNRLFIYRATIAGSHPCKLWIHCIPARLLASMTPRDSEHEALTTWCMVRKKSNLCKKFTQLLSFPNAPNSHTSRFFCLNWSFESIFLKQNNGFYTIVELSPPKSKCVLSEGRSLYSCIHTRTGALLKERRTGENGAGSVQKVNTVDRWRKLLFDTGPANSLQYI